MKAERRAYRKQNIILLLVTVLLLAIFFGMFYYFYNLSYQKQVDSFLEQQNIYASIVKKNLTAR
ncbi:MAG: hypothetical protein ACQEP9_10525, partial [Bacillota bacterium]